MQKNSAEHWIELERKTNAS